MLFCFILENIVNLGRKVRNRRQVRRDDSFFFLEITVFLGEKVHYSERFEVRTRVLFRDHCIFRTKSASPGMISGDDLFFFFGDHCISRTKSALPGTTSSDELFLLEITLNLGRKLVLKISNFIAWFWHPNCMTSLRGHRTPLLCSIFINV